MICSGESERQVKAIAGHIDQTISQACRIPPAIEGMTTAQWVLIDFGDVIAHVFHEPIREHYGLERLWRDAEQVPVPDLPLPTLVSNVEAVAEAPRVRKQG